MADARSVFDRRLSLYIYEISTVYPMLQAERWIPEGRHRFLRVDFVAGIRLEFSPKFRGGEGRKERKDTLRRVEWGRARCNPETLMNPMCWLRLGDTSEPHRPIARPRPRIHLMHGGHKVADGGWWMRSVGGSSRASSGGNAFNRCETRIRCVAAEERVNSVRSQSSGIPTFVLATKAAAEVLIVGRMRRNLAR